MKRLVLFVSVCVSLWGGLSLLAQTNTNRISGVSMLWNTNTNAVTIVKGGRYAASSNNWNGTGWFLESGSSSNEPHWTQLTMTNLQGSLDGSRIHGAVQGGITTNIDYVAPGPFTNRLHFTNGILLEVTGPL